MTSDPGVLDTIKVMASASFDGMRAAAIRM
jgi:hypothetical protein